MDTCLLHPTGGSAVCCLPLSLPTQCGLPRLEKAFLNMGFKGGHPREGLRGWGWTLWAQKDEPLGAQREGICMCSAWASFRSGYWITKSDTWESNSLQLLMTEYPGTIEKVKNSRLRGKAFKLKIPNYKSSFPSWPLLVLNRRGKRRCYAVRSLLRGSPLTSPFSSWEATLSLPLLSPPRIALVLSIPRPLLPWPTTGHNQVGNPSP